ncbi:MAG: diadenylate cyclase CdaA [Bacteroidia bacterium]|nr:diadenylate cyclase CdaA [Bacteroidia bacterium]
MLLFLDSFRWLDAIDIVLVALILFQLYNLIKGTVAINIFIGILLVYLVYLVVRLLKLELLENLLGQFVGIGAIALVVVFQQEIRRFLILIGTNGFVGEQGVLKTIFSSNWKLRSGSKLEIGAITKSVGSMADQKTGAILIIANKSELNFYINTGDILEAQVSSRLIESIFFKNSPLHDGAVIISGNIIKAARCVLPVSENENFPGNLGMRHRAAVGITENSDAIAIVVSEQSGEIAIAKNGNLSLNISREELKRILEEEGQ